MNINQWKIYQLVGKLAAHDMLLKSMKVRCVEKVGPQRILNNQNAMGYLIRRNLHETTEEVDKRDTNPQNRQ